MSETAISNKSNILNKILICLIIVIPLLFVFQGFDLDDTGTHLYNAIHFFDEGRTAHFGSLYSNLITYLVYQVFGNFGLLPLFLFNSLLFIIIAFLNLKIVSNCIPKTQALIGVLIAEIMAMRFIHIVNYNTYTVLIVTLCVLSVYYGIVKDKNLYLFLGGVFTGLSVFFRLPNIFVVTIGLGFIYWAISKSMPFKKFILKTLIYFAGAVAAVAFSVVLALILNKLTPVTIQFWGASQIMSAGGSYSFWGLVDSYILSTIEGLENMWFVAIPFILLICDMLCAKGENKAIRAILHIMFLGIMAVSLIYFANCGIDRFMLPVLCWIVAFIIIALCNTKKYFNRELVLLCILGLAASLVSFAGSNTGILHANLSVGILFPVVIFAFYKLYKHFDFKGYRKVICILLTVSFAAVFAYNYLVLSVTSFEPSHRSEIIYSVNSKKTKGLYTNEFRAQYANTVIDVISELDNKYMVVYPGYDLLYYLTDKSPYLDRVGIGFDSYSAKQLEYDIYAVEDKPLPIILLSKAKPYSYSVGKAFKPDDRQKFLEKFIEDNNYKEYYADDNIAVYIPQ